MSITDELREWVSGAKPAVVDGCSISVGTMTYGCKKALLAIADRIDETYKKAVRELNDYASDSVLLPRDADGEVIHIGDVMERGEAHGRVIALMLSNYPKKWGGELHWGVQLEGEHAPTALDLTFHHYHEPTVEDVLRDMSTKLRQAWIGPETFDHNAIIAEFAAKLRLVNSE